MQLNGEEVKLRIGDIAIFREYDGVVQFMRGSQRLLNHQHQDDKSIVSNDLPLSQDDCSNIASIIAMTHGFSYEYVGGASASAGLFRYRFTRLKKTK
jgi:hypothetical protein